MSFERDMKRIMNNLDKRAERLFDRCLNHVERSIVEGSYVTAAPGQPVRTGALKRSFRKRKYGKMEGSVSTSSPYGHIIEDNLRGAQLRSETGGFHSVKLTRLGWRRIVAFELKRVRGDVDTSGWSVERIGVPVPDLSDD